MICKSSVNGLCLFPLRGGTCYEIMSTPDECQPWLINCGGSPNCCDINGFWHGTPQVNSLGGMNPGLTWSAETQVRHMTSMRCSEWNDWFIGPCRKWVASPEISSYTAPLRSENSSTCMVLGNCDWQTDGFLMAWVQPEFSEENDI